ncbi:MAG: response regulator [Gemmatimonadales bacterium]
MTKVLVVDDSLSVRKAVGFALKPRGFEVLEAASGREALTAIRAEHPALVVCDVIMKDLSGFDVCQAVKDEPALAGTPIILISGIVNEQVRSRATSVGAAMILSKPFRAAELADEVARLLSSRPSVAAAPAAWAPPADDGAMVALRALQAVPSITLAAMVDDQGRLLEQAGRSGPELEELRSQLAEMVLRAEQAGRTRQLGQPVSVMLEFRAGLMLATCLSSGGLLFVEVSDAGALGLVRYEMRRVLQTLAFPAVAPTVRA